MKRIKLKVEKRKVLGRKVKRLRKEGFLPVNLYGKGIQSQALQVPLADFEKVFKEAGETQLVELAFDSTVHPVLIHNIQYEPRTGSFLHADFRKVDLKEEVKTMVPVVPLGEPKAVTDKVGLLLQLLSEVEIEALPTNLPEKIEVDVTGLEALDQQITVTDLKVPSSVKIVTDPSQVVFKVGELVTKEVEELVRQEEEAALAAKAEAAAERGEEPETPEVAPTPEAQPEEEKQEIPSPPQEEKPKE